ncbi:MAG TPA: hypothetical protein VMR92_05615 [Gemmatimonadales bacterium]|jgi:hypothetical protein|nr:hypothetical protein [Gemmatimonadales bacterium]
MKRLSTLALVAVVVATGISCGDKGVTGVSGPGELNVRLTSPPSALDSAIVFTITGPVPLTGVTVGPGLRLFQQPLGGTSTKFALIGQLTNGALILTIGVQDLAVLSQYSGTINGVALPTYQLRTLPGGYALALLR